jgi:hypothetical protein
LVKGFRHQRRKHRMYPDGDAFAHTLTFDMRMASPTDGSITLPGQGCPVCTAD